VRPSYRDSGVKQRKGREKKGGRNRARLLRQPVRQCAKEGGGGKGREFEKEKGGDAGCLFVVPLSRCDEGRGGKKGRKNRSEKKKGEPLISPSFSIVNSSTEKKRKGSKKRGKKAGHHAHSVIPAGRKEGEEKEEHSRAARAR